MVVLTVLFVLVVFSILAIQVFQVSRQFQHSSFRFEHADIAQRGAEATISAGFTQLRIALENPDSPISRWVLREVSLPPGKAHEPLVLSTPILEPFQASLRNQGLHLEVETTASIRDLRKDDGGSPYAGHECFGTIGLVVRTQLFGSSLAGKGSRIAGCRMVRYHDFKVLGLVNGVHDAARQGYAGAFPLDYALLVRNGYQEFHETNGVSLNNPYFTLGIVQPSDIKRAGKVFLGGTPRSASAAGKGPIFLNTPPDLSPLIPPFDGKGGPPQIGLTDCVGLRPTIAQVASYQTVFANLLGIFTISNEPFGKEFPQDLIGGEKKAFEAVENGLAEAKTGAESNISPGVLRLPVDLLSQPEFLEAVMEGETRQRFLYFVRFNFDWTKCDPSAAAEFIGKRATFPCLEPTTPSIYPELRAFYGYLPTLNQRFTGQGQPPVLSNMVDSFPFGGKFQGGFPPFDPPKPGYPADHFFFTPGNERLMDQPTSAKFSPFWHVTLWSRTFTTPDDLERFGILDRKAGKLRLHGAVWVKKGTIDLGTASGKPLLVEGCGMLVAERINVRTGLERDPADGQDLCCLYAYGPPPSIGIATKDPIQAVLIAVNEHANGSLGFDTGAGSLRLNGALICDRLGSARRFGVGFATTWPRGAHEIAYDPLLKSGLEVDSVTISPWITYERILGEDQ